MHVILDFETRSEVDLKKSGIYRYVMDPTTVPYFMAWKWAGGNKTHLLNEAQMADISDPDTRHFMRILLADAIELHAHNAAVERLIIEHICGPRWNWPIPRRSRWRCSAARVGKLALPRSLEKAAKALNVAVQKDEVGGKIMKRLMKPTKYVDGVPVWDLDPVKYARVGEYCKTDVDTEEAVEAATFPLTKDEQRRYLLIERMNDRGVRVDVDRTRKLLAQAQTDGRDLNAEMDDLTWGHVPKVTNVGALKTWIESETGVSLKTLRKEDMENLGSGDEHPFAEYPNVARAIELRQLGGKSSVAKLSAILARVCHDGMLRGAFMANATSTGRLVSLGVQLQNLPRECLKDYDLRMKDIEGLTVRDISTAIRGLLIPEEGYVFVDADFNAIEARGVGWLAGADKLTNLFRTGGDPYCAIACVIYSRLIENIPEQANERFVGKQTILGCGYGMGAPKFEAQCIKFGKPVGPVVAEKAVKAYREDYPEIPLLWKGLEKAAIGAVRSRGRVTDYNGIAFKLSSGFLQMRLPSGRRLYYADPKVREVPAPWDPSTKLPKLSYMAVSPLTKQWHEESTWGGKLTENAVQALCCDLLMDAQIRIERRGASRDITMRLSVHDQAIAQAPERHADYALKLVQEEMERGEDWARGFPIKAEPKIARRFGK